MVKELKLKLKSRLRKRVVSEETVKEKKPTSFGTKPLPTHGGELKLHLQLWCFLGLK